MTEKEKIELPKYKSVEQQMQDIIYHFASASVNGLPAIPEKHFKDLGTMILNKLRISK